MTDDFFKREYHDIGVYSELKLVRIANDNALKSYLKNGKRKSCLELAEHILDRYQKEFGCPLNIKPHSLSVEIYDHYLLQEITYKIEKITGEIRPTQWMINHMKVIDCGERDIDNNRFLWDMLAFFK